MKAIHLILTISLTAILFSCSSQPVVVTHPSRQTKPTPPPATQTTTTTTKTTVVTTKPIETPTATVLNTEVVSADTSLVDVNAVDPKALGAVLPLSGKNASLGERALKALRLALEEKDPKNAYKLAVYDSESNPEEAAIGAEKLVKEDKVIAILGGFSAKEVQAIAAKTEQLKVPYFGFTQKSGITKNTLAVYRNAVTAEMQINKLLSFAIDDLDAKKFAVLYPEDSYGNEFKNTFVSQAAGLGASVVIAQSYEPKENDFSDPVKAILDMYDNVETVGEGADKKIKNGFDILFIPDSSKALGQIMAFMKYYKASNIVYMGTNLWNTPELVSRANLKNGGVYFVDSFDSSQTALTTSSFYKEFQSKYSEAPSITEVQVYEAAKIIKDQLATGHKTRIDLNNSLQSLGRAEGVTGELRMSEFHEIERPLYILNLKDGLLKNMD